MSTCGFCHPRDLYLSSQYSKSPDFKFLPKNDVDAFIIYYRNMRKHKISSDRILKINFEEFIYDYDNTINKVESFLHLKEHERKKQIFDPMKSVNNTQLLRLHPEDEKQIKKIEKELPEYLFPFNKYKEIEFTGKPFEGAARNMIEQ